MTTTDDPSLYDRFMSAMLPALSFFQETQVVSLIVAERVPMREDLRVPSEQVRDDQGRVIAARGLPALAIPQ